MLTSSYYPLHDIVNGLFFQITNTYLYTCIINLLYLGIMVDKHYTAFKLKSFTTALNTNSTASSYFPCSLVENWKWRCIIANSSYVHLTKNEILLTFHTLDRKYNKTIATVTNTVLLWFDQVNIQSDNTCINT